MSRCVCGRVYQNRWREAIAVLLLVIVFAAMVRAERERREYRAARAELGQLGNRLKVVLDSIAASPRRGR